MAGKVVPLLFGDLSIELIGLNFDYNGEFVHDPNPSSRPTSRTQADGYAWRKWPMSAFASTATPTG
jgi:hypothetical protein